jgi:transcription termination/antitermination protein NusG
MKWYTLRVATGKERKAKEIIEKETSNNKLDNYLGQVLIPKEKVFKIKNGKRIKSERAYLPGYLLVQLDLNGEIIPLIKKVNGVQGFLGGENPLPMRDSEINRILGKMDELSEEDTIIDDNFVIGECLKITEGPFSEFTGFVEKIESDKNRIVLNVKVFNRETPVELKYTQVQRI